MKFRKNIFLKIDIKKLLFMLFVIFGVSFIGSLFTITNINSWYSTLIKPSFNPPNWIFGPVWSVLYLMIAISGYIILSKKESNQRRVALVIFSIQLLLNLVWSLIFFGLNNPAYAFVEILILWFFILVNIIVFYKINKKSGYLLIPYILWVSFAAFLNYSIMILN